jgi:alpha,alpha-trehalose phosphorylase
MRDHDGVLSFRPRLPQALARLRFRVCFRARRLMVDIAHQQATYSLSKGPALEIVHHGERGTVDPRQPLTRPIPRPPRRRSPKQPPGRAPARRRPAR